MLGLALALTSALCWGVADFVGGVQARRLPVLRVTLVTQAAGLVVLAVVLAARGQPVPALHRLLPAAAGGLAGVAGLAAFFRALAMGTMSIVAPLAATGAGVPVLVGLATGERPAPLQLAGIMTAMIGVALAGRERDHGSKAASARTSVLLALAAALGFGCFYLGLRASARADPLWATGAARVAAVLALLAVSARIRPSARAAGGLGVLILAGTLDVSANILYAVATRHGLLSAVSVLAALYPLATVLLARLVLGERVGRARGLGVLAAVTGIALIAAG